MTGARRPIPNSVVPAFIRALAIAHRLSTVRDADRILVLDGELVEEGPRGTARRRAAGRGRDWAD